MLAAQGLWLGTWRHFQIEWSQSFSQLANADDASDDASSLASPSSCPHASDARPAKFGKLEGGGGAAPASSRNKPLAYHSGQTLTSIVSGNVSVKHPSQPYSLNRTPETQAFAKADDAGTRIVTCSHFKDFISRDGQMHPSPAQGREKGAALVAHL